jgi:ribonucleoside-diphosphate reductase subunit M1
MTNGVGSIAVSNLHKQTKKQFSQVIHDLYTYVNPKNKLPSPMISKETYEVVMAHAEELDSAVIYDKDFNYNYFGFKTMEVSPKPNPHLPSHTKGGD